MLSSWNLSPELFDLVMNQLDAVSIVNEKGEYIYVNKGWLDSFHMTIEQVRGLHPWDIIEDTYVPTVLKQQRPIYSRMIPDLKGQIRLTSYFPLFKDGVFCGIFINTQIPESECSRVYTNLVNDLMKKLEETQGKLRMVSSAHYSIGNIIGESQAIWKMKDEIISAARTSSTVLIEGETGTGKELVAHAIHDLSYRRSRNFIRVNCSAIPPELMESEFFGYEEGSFTGSKKGGKKGKFELADKGSLFLDEVNTLPLALQPKFLRVLQEREVEHIGGKDAIPLDIRIIAATNKPLEQLVNEGSFREDLFYRLNVINIKVPPLRERKEDISLLTDKFISNFNSELNMDIAGVEPGVIEFLCDYDWPGNVRELQNVIERAMNRAGKGMLKLEHFDKLNNKISGTEITDLETSAVSDVQVLKITKSLKQRSQEEERHAIINALTEAGGNKTKAARMLGISRTALYKKMSRLGLE